MSPAGLLLRGLIRAYQLLLSPILPASCRFTPSCSAYGLEAVRRHGALKGGWLALWRVLRCNPWGGMGDDPVPEHFHFHIHLRSGRACNHGGPAHTSAER